MVLKGNRYKKEKKTVKNTFSNAWNGIWYTFNNEINLKIHMLAAILVLIGAYILELNYYEIIICMLLIGLVISFELINTLVEMIIDLVSPKYNELAGMIKDVAAGAVLVISITALIIGIAIFLPKILIYIGL